MSQCSVPWLSVVASRAYALRPYNIFPNVLHPVFFTVCKSSFLLNYKFYFRQLQISDGLNGADVSLIGAMPSAPIR